MAVHQIKRSARLDVTARMIRQIEPQSVLEIGSAEFSFQAEAGQTVGSWFTVDAQGDCDYIVDINREDIRLPLQDESVDLVVCTEVLEHLLWPHVLLKEIRRILKSSGRVLVSVPNMNSLSYRLAWAIGHLPSCAASGNLPLVLGSTAYEVEGRLTGGHVIDFNNKRLCGLLEYCQFDVERVVGCGLYWRRQLVPEWMLPATLSSNLIGIARKR